MPYAYEFTSSTLYTYDNVLPAYWMRVGFPCDMRKGLTHDLMPSDTRFDTFICVSAENASIWPNTCNMQCIWSAELLYTHIGPVIHV